ncbi:MAG: DUF721 domain-containing protein, partial [Paracoccus sp. (in: a-proteobacteria)]|nr:DUF721 domain-containing protein [Paracoccus sp. (in: a-proteobacteria)]
RPVRIAHSRSGFGATLTLLTTGASAPLIEMWLPALRERVNACYGYNAIARIQVTQTAPTGFAEAQAQFSAAPAPGPAARLPDARTRCEAESLAANVTDPALRAALTRLAMLKLTREGKPNRKAP